MQHNSIPSNPILNGVLSALLRFPMVYNTTGIDTGKKVCRIRATVERPVLLEFWARVSTAFNAATTNLLTVGSDFVSANQFLAAGDITEGTVGFYPASNAIKKYWLETDTDVIIRSNGGVQANNTLTSNNTNVADGVTVTLTDPISGTTEVYTFRTTLGTAEGDVLIGADADASLLNLIRAINHSGTAGTDYFKAAASVLVTAATSVTAHAFLLTAIRGGTGGNSLTAADSSATLTWTGATFANGTNGSVSAGAADIFMRVSQFDPKNSNNLGVS